MNIRFVLIILFLFFSKISLAGTMTATSGNMDYAMTRSLAPDVFDGLVLHVPLRHSGMSYAQDVSQYQTQGTITGATWATGTARGLYFDGVNDDVSFGDPADGHLDFGTSSFGFGFWQMPTKLDGILHILFSKGLTSSPTGGYTLWNNQSTLIPAAILSFTSGVKTIAFGTSVVGTNTMTHVFCVVDQSDYPTGTARVFFNGVQVGTGTNLGTGTINSSNSLFLGKRTDGSFPFPGYIDDARIYNRAPSNDEVNRIYQATKH